MSTYDPQSHPWWWNPYRPGAVNAPDWFRKQLAEIDPELKVIWNAFRERWQVWAPKPSLQNPISQGWLLLFPVQHADGSYCPLDERTLAKIYEVSAHKWGDAKQYWHRIENEINRDKEKMVEDRKNGVADTSGDYWNYLQPKVGYGKSTDSILK